MRAQDNDVQLHLNNLYENDEEAAVHMEEAYEVLTELSQQPLDINKVTQEDLMQIPGLTQYQINDILEYRYRYGRLRSIEELAMIPSIDRRLRLVLSQVLTVGVDKDKHLYLHHNLAFTLQSPTYYRAGDRNAPLHTYLGKNKYAGKYMGDPLKHSLRYSLSVGSNITFNLSGGKTAGEPFGENRNKWGYDQYAYNVSIKNLGRFSHIVAGQFRGQFGMGLILNNNFAMGKQGMLASMGRRATTFIPHSSPTDSKHLQGVAATMRLTGAKGILNLAAFLSYRNIDATLNADGTISTILTSGYHRTELEIAKKNNSTQTTAGMHAGYDFSIQNTGEGKSRHMMSVGLGVIYTGLNRDINPTYSKSGNVTKGKLYRLYYPRGDRFWNASVDYRYQWRELAFSGETAVDGKGNPATINNLTWRSPWGVTFMALQRYYSYKYCALYGNSFGENSEVRNESGLYLGAQWNVSRSVTLEGYSDIAYFPYFRYRVNSSSYVWDNSVMGTLTRGDWKISLRYRTKKEQHRLRILAQYGGSKWSLRTQVEATALSSDERSKGILLSQSVSYKLRERFELYAHLAWFNTDDYDSRLYVYERGMLYSFGSSSYYGKGLRSALFARYSITGWLTLLGKVAHTRYFDRNTIGTAERIIFSRHCTDLEFQALLKL